MKSTVRRPVMPAPLLGGGDDVLDLLDARRHRAERHEVDAGHGRHQPRQRRLARARRSPQDQRVQQAAIERLTQRPARRRAAPAWPTTSSRRPRPHALGERRAGARSCGSSGNSGDGHRTARDAGTCAVPASQRTRAADDGDVERVGAGAHGNRDPAVAARQRGVGSRRLRAEQEHEGGAAARRVGRRAAAWHRGRDRTPRVRAPRASTSASAPRADRHTERARPSRRAAPSSPRDRPCRRARPRAVAPRASALRMMPPTLPGSCTPTSADDDAPAADRRARRRRPTAAIGPARRRRWACCTGLAASTTAAAPVDRDAGRRGAADEVARPARR